jgi:thiol:disulfide interchange protein DsbC
MAKPLIRGARPGHVPGRGELNKTREGVVQYFIILHGVFFLMLFPRYALPFAGALALSALVSLSAQAADTETTLRQSLEKAMPGLPVSKVTAAPVSGLYEVQAGPEIFYATTDGRYVFTGNLIDLSTRQNLTENVRATQRVELLKTLPAEKLLVYPAKGTRKHVLTILTDHTCPYCRKLHAEVPALNEAGVEVRYLLTPRAGADSPAYKDSESILCAADKREAMDKAMSGQSVVAKSCADTPLPAYMGMAEQMGMSGTPFIVTDTGQVVPGYRPAKDLVRMLEGK